MIIYYSLFIVSIFLGFGIELYPKSSFEVKLNYKQYFYIKVYKNYLLIEYFIF